MSAQPGSRIPLVPAGPVLRLPPTPRILVIAGRCAVWAMHLVLLAWLAGQLLDVAQGHARGWVAVGAVVLTALMLWLWWHMPPVGWLRHERVLVPADAHAERNPDAWREPAADPDACVRLRVLLDSGAGVLLQVRGPVLDAITWVPARHLGPEIRWHLRGQGAGRTGA